MYILDGRDYKSAGITRMCSVVSSSSLFNRFQGTEAVTGGVLWKKLFLEISQNSQENTSARVSFLVKLQAWSRQLCQKRHPGTGVFLWILQNFQEHLSYRTPLSGCFWGHWYISIPPGNNRKLLVFWCFSRGMMAPPELNG